MNPPGLEIKALTRRFETFTAVDAMTLTMAAGEVFGLLGSNGAGKMLGAATLLIITGARLYPHLAS